MAVIFANFFLNMLSHSCCGMVYLVLLIYCTFGLNHFIELPNAPSGISHLFLSQSKNVQKRVARYIVTLSLS